LRALLVWKEIIYSLVNFKLLITLLTGNTLFFIKIQKLFMSKTETPCLTRNKSLIYLPSWVEVSSA
jgi:hypothetical protein